MATFALYIRYKFSLSARGTRRAATSTCFSSSSDLVLGHPRCGYHGIIVFKLPVFVGSGLSLTDGIEGYRSSSAGNVRLEGNNLPNKLQSRLG